MITLAPDAFLQEGYFEAYVKYIEGRRQAWAEGWNPELVDFIPPVLDNDGLGDDETMPFDGEAATPDDDDDEAVAHEDSDNDEDPDA